MCNPKLNYGNEVSAFSSKSEEKRLEQVQEREGSFLYLGCHGVSLEFW